MSNNNIIIALVVAVIVVIGGWLLLSHKAAAPTTEQPVSAQTETTATTSTDTGTSAGVSVGVTTGTPTVITYTDSGFSPKSVTVKVGTTVRFVNNSSHGMWVASNNHPTHTQYDGTSVAQHCAAGADTNGGFDECTAIQPQSVYSFTFAKTGTFMYHNHVSASDTGTVVVTN